MRKYVLECLGTMVVLIAKLLTEANPVIMGIVYFSIYWMSQGITTGYFSPFGPMAAFLLNRGTQEDITYNLISQFIGAFAAIMLLKPIKAYIE